jgi:hypothetical protein
MTKDEQRQFAQDLITDVTKAVLVELKKAPSNWDGKQIRRYIAEAFQERAQISRYMCPGEEAEYFHDCIVNKM